MIQVSVFYENKEGARFDVDYYITKHMPMVEKMWADDGLKSSAVLKGLGGGAPGAPAPYKIMAQFVFDSMESLQKALQKTAALQEDLPNFTDTPPSIQISEIAHSRDL